jgi:hypothetical protein
VFSNALFGQTALLSENKKAKQILEICLAFFSILKIITSASE